MKTVVEFCDMDAIGGGTLVDAFHSKLLPFLPRIGETVYLTKGVHSYTVKGVFHIFRYKGAVPYEICIRVELARKV